MRTLTITDAKKNLSRWLDAAVRGENIGIIRGAEIVALRRVAVESVGYAQDEYAVTPEQVKAFAKATDKRYRRVKRSGKFVTVTPEQLRHLLA
jgi:antitoxin (DNA-binding transcriptional repressor) of toxin-antitoxin stability system